MRHQSLSAEQAQHQLQRSAAAGSRVTRWVIVASVGLGAVKVIAGILGHSYALLADGIESMLDVLSSLVVLGSLKISTKSPDQAFPFGYGKVEPIAALMIATALLAAALGIAIQSLREIQSPQHAPAPFTLIVLIVVVVAKETIFRVLLRTGNAIGSHILETDAWHHRSDSLTSLAAFVGISVSLLAGEGYESADEWAALFAAGVIAVNGGRLLRTAWREILDASPPPEVVDEIRAISAAVPGVRAIDMCRMRKSGLGLWVDIHVVVDGDISVREGHRISHAVKDALIGSRHTILDAVVHVEPE